MATWLLLLIAYIPFQIALNPYVGFDLASLRVFIVLFSLFFVIKKLINRNLPRTTNFNFTDKQIEKSKKQFIKNKKNKFLVRGLFKNSYFYNLPGICLILFLFLSGLSLIGAENIFWGIRKIIFFLSIFPIYFLSIALINNWQKIKKTALILVISSSFLAFIGLLQFLSQFVFGLEKTYSFWAINILPIFSGFNLGAMILTYPSWLVNIDGETVMRAFSLFSDPHMLSFYIGLVLPLLVGLLYFKKTKNFLLIASYLLIFTALLLTFARGAYIAIIISFLVLAFLFWKYLNNKKIVILLCLSLLIFIIPITPIADRFYSTFNINEGSNVGRLEMWQMANKIGMNSFWHGIGIGNYSLAIDSEFDYRNPATAHNLYLDIFSEMGFFGFVVWLVLILGSIWIMFRKLRFLDNKKQKCILICLIGSLSYFFIHSFFETAIYSPSVLALLMIILGLSVVLVKKEL